MHARTSVTLPTVARACAPASPRSPFQARFQADAHARMCAAVCMLTQAYADRRAVMRASYAMSDSSLALVRT
eukprot:6172853-Pleurochrysis_carterae.AAC.1